MSHPLEETTAHPLFPVGEDADDDEIKTVTSIHIARKENGKLMFAPRPRSASELESLEQIHSEFGGGEYVLIGYNNGRISARRNVNLSGKPKPLYDEGIPDTPPVVQAPPPADPMMAMMGGSGGFLPFLAMMMQQQSQSADRQMQLFMAMIQGTRESSAEDKAQARAEMQANVERERIASERMMTLMREAMTNKGGDSSNGFTQGVEFMRSFSMMQIEQMKNNAKEGDGTDWGSLIETLGQALQGFGMLKGMAGGGLPEGAPGIPVPEVVAQ